MGQAILCFMVMIQAAISLAPECKRYGAMSCLFLGYLDHEQGWFIYLVLITDSLFILGHA